MKYKNLQILFFLDLEGKEVKHDRHHDPNNKNIAI